MLTTKVNNKFARLRSFLAGILAGLFALVMSACNVFAAENEIKLSADTSDLTPGQSVTVKVELPEDLPIYALTATLQYDENIFEPIETTSFTIPATTYLSYNAKNRAFGLVNQSGAIDQNLFAVQLRVKDDPGVGDTNIALTNITSADGSEQTKYPPAIITVSVTKDASDGATVPVVGSNEINETPSESISAFVTTPFIIAGVLLAVALVIAAVIYYRRTAQTTNRSRRPIYIILGAGVAVLVLVALLVGFNRSKKDIDHDGKVDYNDAVAIVDYLINATGSHNDSTDADNSGADSGDGSIGHYFGGSSTGSAAAQSGSSTNSTPRPDDSGNNDNNAGDAGHDPLPPDRFDTDNNGHVDVGDAGHNAEQAQKETKVKLEYSDQQLAYVEKGAHTLTFRAHVEPADVALHSVKIKDVDGEHGVDCVGDVCTVEIPAQDTAGKRQFTITDVTTNNDKAFQPNFTISFEVLKDTPSVTDVDPDEKQKSVSFHLVDPDHALTSSEATIYDHAIQTSLAQSDNLQHNEVNVITYEHFEDNGEYNLSVKGDYCRTENSGTPYCFENHTFFNHNFMMLKEYIFELKDFYVSDYVDAGNHPTMTFVSTNNLNSPVYQATVKIDNTNEHTYDVVKVDDNRYEVLLDKATLEPGTHHVSLESVTIDTLKTFVNNKDYTITRMPYLVPTAIPEVEDLILDNQDEHKRVHATFKVKDNLCVKYGISAPRACTLNKLTLVMTDSSGNVVDTRTFSLEDIRNTLAAKPSVFEANFSYVGNDGRARSDRKFKVEVLADYDLGSKHNYSDKKLIEKSISAFDANGLKIDDLYGESYNPETKKYNRARYVKKGEENYRLVYHPNPQKGYLIPSANCGGAEGYNDQPTATINGLNYTVYNPFGRNDPQKGYRAANLTMPNEAGVVNLEISRLQYMINGYYCKINDWYPIDNTVYQVEVLRDEPYIANFEVREDRDKSKVTFAFDVIVDPAAVDAPNVFTDAYFMLSSEPNNRQTVNIGHNEFTFDTTPGEFLGVEIHGTYDLDSNALNEYNEDKRNEHYYENALLLMTFCGIFDYDNVVVSNPNVLSASGGYTNNYFEKNEDVKLNFNLEGLPTEFEMYGITPSRVTVKDQEYDLVQNEDDGSYSIVLPGFPNAGPEVYTITDVVFSNGEKAHLEQSVDFSFEVLKDAPTVTDFSYEEKDNQVKVKFRVNDPDEAIIGQLYGDARNATDESQSYYAPFSPEATEFTFDKYSDLYYFDITAKYSRVENNDSGQKDTEDHQYLFDNATLLDATLSFAENYVELKDIDDISLYHVDTNGNVELVDETTVDKIMSDLDNYFVEVAMQSMPTIRAEVKKAADEEGQLVLTVEEDYLTVDDEAQSNELHLNYGKIDSDGKATNEFHPAIAFQKLLNDLNANHDVTLDRDYDASVLSLHNEGTYVTKDYSGHFNGNGHTIKNLNKPFFNALKEGANIENLTLRNVTLTNGDQKGALANTAKSATIYRVAADNFRHKTAAGDTGSLIGSADNSTIDESRSVGFEINVPSFSGHIGGFIGNARGSNIKNNYVTGTLVGNWNSTGGFIGDASSSTIESNYSKVSYKDNGYANYNICGFVCSDSAAPTLSHNIALNELIGNKGMFKPFASTLADNSSGNFYLANDGYNIPEDQKARIATIDKDQINADLFRKNASFDESIWRINNDTSYDNLPTFAFERDVATAIEKAEEYKPANTIAYNNMQKLIPYFEYEKIVETGNSLSNSDLKTKPIKHLAPLDSNGNLVTYLTTEDPKRISTLRIVFEDGTKQDYGVVYENTYDMVANYVIRDLNLNYNFPHYVIDNSTRIVDNLVSYLSTLDYAANLDTLTAGADSRIYRDFYNETTKNELREFVLKYLSNSNLTSTTDNRSISSHLERQIKNDRKIEKALYVYNYLRRFYDLSFDNLKLYDIAMFNMQGFNSDYTTDTIINKFMSDPANFNTSTTEKTFMTVYGTYCGMNSVSDLIETAATKFSNVTDMSEWARGQFKGYLVEIPVEGHSDVQYTLWDHFSHWDTIYSDYGSGNRIRNQILPILTLPANSAYIFSMPVEFIIGNQRTYIANPDDPNQHGQLVARAEPYRARLQNYFNTAYGLIKDANVFNNIHVFQTDSRITRDMTGSTVYNTAGSADPFTKNYNEVLGRWSASDGNAAVAWGDRIDWSAESFLESVFIPEVAQQLGVGMTSNTWDTFTHESAHNIDARLFLKNNGRRFDSGGEDYADSFLMQNFDPNGVNMNLSIGDLRTALDGGLNNKNYGSNYNYETINSNDKIKNYYSNLFDAIYAMDYIEAQAFLELEPEDQAIIGAQVSYPDATGSLEEVLPNEGEAADLSDTNVAGKAYDAATDKTISPYRAYRNTRYTKLEAEKFRNMKLEDIDDLYENRIMVIPGLYYGYSTRSDNMYGGEGYNTVHWYQPHNNYGRPDSYSFKWLTFEMIGNGGYDGGFIEYGSNINNQSTPITVYLDAVKDGKVTESKKEFKVSNYKSDAMALKAITGKESFEAYKKDRFAEVALKLNRVDSAVDIKNFATELYDALKQDAENFRKALNDSGFNDLKACANDKGCADKLSRAMGLSKSTALRQKFLNDLKVKTEDFTTGTVFNHNKQQDFGTADDIRNLIKQHKQNTSAAETVSTIDFEAETAEPAIDDTSDQQQDVKDLETVETTDTTETSEATVATETVEEPSSAASE